MNYITKAHPKRFPGVDVILSEAKDIRRRILTPGSKLLAVSLGNNYDAAYSKNVTGNTHDGTAVRL
jgi:hypothetical protein